MHEYHVKYLFVGFFRVCLNAVFRSQMQPQLTFVSELHVALITRVRFFSGMDAQVGLQSLKVSEAGQNKKNSWLFQLAANLAISLFQS